MQKTAVQHLIAIVIFLAVALIYCYPALQGNKLAAGDTIHWMGMSQEAKTWYEKTGENPLWSNSMFGGMPTVTHYMRGKTNLIYPIQEFLTDTLPSPVFFFLIAMICFYILMNSMGVNRWIGVIGAVAFAFASYNLQIIAAGHNTKMFSIGYMPLVLAGMHWIYRGRYLIGAGAALVGMSLMVSNGMYQIVYYFVVFVATGLFLAYMFQALKEKKVREFLIATGIMAVVALVSVGPSLDMLLYTNEYKKQTMRGGQSEFTLGKDKKSNGGLDKDYAFQWSEGIGETFTLLVPNLYGGGSMVDLGTNSHYYEAVKGLGVNDDNAAQISARASTYWGDQPFLSGPVYFGAIIIFLMVLGLFIIRHQMKWFLFGVGVVGIFLSWGRHFSGFNYFLFDHLPFFNNFRTPSMAMVIPGLTFCIIALWALQEFLFGEESEERRMDALKKSVIVVAGLCLVFGIGSRAFLSFKGPNDDKLKMQMVQMTGNEQAGATLFNALVEDRQDIAMSDGIRSLVFILLAAAVLWFFNRKKLGRSAAVAAVGILIAVDLLSIGMRYIGPANYMPEDEFEAQFSPRPVDTQIKQDPDPFYRVLDLTTDPYNGAMQAFHHKCVGGYHPAKLETYQDLISYHLSGGKMNAEVLNMLNTKYIIFNGQNNQPAVQPNPNRCGNAWFVNEVKLVPDANEEMKAMTAEGLGDTTAVANPFRARQTAIVQQKLWKGNTTSFVTDSNATIRLTKYGLNDLSYESSNAQAGFAIFSDIYYPYGWKAFVDGKETPIVKSDYLLRGLNLPAGNHKIEFKFHPDTYFKWNTASLASSIFILLILAGGIGLGIRDEMKKKATA
ncbi:MAG: YfhO family protein [Chitinophagaceae bacterium]|nr:YfhO family protein [Chitinophagaceae bacterium]